MLVRRGCLTMRPNLFQTELAASLELLHYAGILNLAVNELAIVIDTVGLNHFFGWDVGTLWSRAIFTCTPVRLILRSCWKNSTGMRAGNTQNLH